jgi:hypothetical protein
MSAEDKETIVRRTFEKMRDIQYGKFHEEYFTRLSAHLVGIISEFPMSRSKVGGESSSPG